MYMLLSNDRTAREMDEDVLKAAAIQTEDDLQITEIQEMVQRLQQTRSFRTQTMVPRTH